jgi:hypothetical protein
MVQIYEKGTKFPKRYKITKKVRSYEKGTQLRKRYEVTKQVRSYEHGTFSTFCQLDVFFSNTVLKSNKRFFFEYRKYFIRQRWLPVTEGHLTPPSEVTNMVRSSEKSTKRIRNKLRKTLVMKLTSYEIVTPPIGIIYYDV